MGQIQEQLQQLSLNIQKAEDVANFLTNINNCVKFKKITILLTILLNYFYIVFLTLIKNYDIILPIIIIFIIY